MPRRDSLFCVFFSLFIAATCSILHLGCDEEGSANGSDLDSDSDGDTDADTDGDTDADSDSDSDSDCPPDECPFEGGIEFQCQLRFMYGINYAWNQFAADFGGLSEWNITGVAGNSADYSADLTDMKEHGVNVIRWWMFPDFRGDAVEFDSSDTPINLGGSTVADIQKALELAESLDVYIMFTLFSFDAFKPTEEIEGIYTPGIKPVITDDNKLEALVDNVVIPIAEAVEESPYKHRMVAWDVINEPEWAITGPGLYGDDEDFDPDSELEWVTHSEMEHFLAEVIAGIRDHSSAMVNVGAAARKWLHAWQNLDVDFYQLHMYDWVNEWWPYDDPVSDFAFDDKPIIMGEFFTYGLPNATYLEEVDAYYNIGYAGALSWQYIESSPDQLDDIKAFADSHPCETQYESIYSKSRMDVELLTAPLPSKNSVRRGAAPSVLP